jgi:hypothetical protein
VGLLSNTRNRGKLRLARGSEALRESVMIHDQIWNWRVIDGKLKRSGLKGPESSSLCLQGRGGAGKIAVDNEREQV